MPLVLFALSAIGLVFLIVCICLLVAPFVGWSCKYNCAVVQTTANIPKAGRYSISIRRDRFWLWKGFGKMADAFPRANFSVMRYDTNEMIPYFTHRSLSTSKSFGSITVLAGYFDVPYPGYYLITSLPESRFINNDEIVIRKHLSFGKLFLLICGICIGAVAFLVCLIFGILSSIGVM